MVSLQTLAVDFPIKTTTLHGVAGGADLVDLHQQYIAIAIVINFLHMLEMPRGLPLDPIALARARPVGCFTVL